MRFNLLVFERFVVLVIVILPSLTKILWWGFYNSWLPTRMSFQKFGHILILLDNWLCRRSFLNRLNLNHWRSITWSLLWFTINFPIFRNCTLNSTSGSRLNIIALIRSFILNLKVRYLVQLRVRLSYDLLWSKDKCLWLDCNFLINILIL